MDMRGDMTVWKDVRVGMCGNYGDDLRLKF